MIMRRGNNGPDSLTAGFLKHSPGLVQISGTIVNAWQNVGMYVNYVHRSYSLWHLALHPAVIDRFTTK
jgi:hypothetical protein